MPSTSPPRDDERDPRDKRNSAENGTERDGFFLFDGCANGPNLYRLAPLRVADPFERERDRAEDDEKYADQRSDVHKPP